jgi:hypothetical protein
LAKLTVFLSRPDYAAMLTAQTEAGVVVVPPQAKTSKLVRDVLASAITRIDAATGLARAGGSTFEQYVGKVLDAEFLLNAGVEMASLFIPGARLAEIVISRSIKAGKAQLAH